MPFPLEALEKGGFVFARAPEWVILTREMAEYATAPGLEHFKRLVGMHAAADEIFWPTLVLNIPNFTQRISKQGWYIRWNKDSSSHSPEVLTESHMKQIAEQRDMYLFVRKVEEAASATLLHEFDVTIQAEQDNFAGLPASLAAKSLEEPIDRRKAFCRSELRL